MATTIQTLTGTNEGNLAWSAKRSKSEVQAFDIRKAKPHPDNMRNQAGASMFGVVLKEDTLDSDELIPQIIAAGGLTEKPVLSKQADGFYVILRGHRRQDAIRKMLSDDKLALSKELRDKISKVEVEVYEGLTAAQEMDLLQDQNSKPYTASQDMIWFWNLLKCGYSFRGLLERILSRKGTASDNQTVIKRAEVRSLTGQAREEFLYNWFKGTYVYYYKNAFDLGPVVQKAALLTERLREFPQGDKPEFFTARTSLKNVNSQARIGALVTAANEDKKAGKWNPITGGPALLDKIAEFHAEDFDKDGNVITNTSTPKAPDFRIKTNALKERIDAAKSEIEKAAFTLANGGIVENYGNLQDQAFMLEQKLKFHADNRTKLPTDKQKLIDIILMASIADFQKLYESQMSK
jgi:hypothetical protein